MTSATTIKQPRQFHWRGLRVPYVALWSSEKEQLALLVRTVGGEWRNERIGYTDELPTDRRQETLWVRYSVSRGSGTPDLALMHPLRQRQALERMLCQVCGKSTYDEAFRRWGERHLFIRRDPDNRPISDGELTATPPVCEPCAIESARSCPHLRRGYTAALVKYAEPWGVSGYLYDSALERSPSVTSVPYTDPRIRSVQARRDIAMLHGCTTIRLDDLATIDAA
ncbi:hypothetical protein ACFYXM_10720 [Streptomyces sp. NPDC002476]|uniref:hypothetical protein n=1 Tax=Streptomyces sp. NPDC002476 TaxID=3364648 RepID=UPI0036853DD6